ncbi:MAG TPA: hypothetical protein VFO39_05025 [Candidatus Sulfotelmatobacter sp.]|nr:hypothetical protein [Candidatus Sulfotelmatobacter sp.]
MNPSLRSFRKPALIVSTLVFLGYTLWAAHTPGESRTVKDFMFLLGLFGVPFLVFAYSLWLLSGGASELEETGSRNEARRSRVGLIGAILALLSAALLLLLEPFWISLVEHPDIGAIWVVLGMVLAVVATVCGIVGSSRLRRAALASILLLPFWVTAGGLLIKAIMD